MSFTDMEGGDYLPQGGEQQAEGGGPPHPPPPESETLGWLGDHIMALYYTVTFHISLDYSRNRTENKNCKELCFT